MKSLLSLGITAFLFSLPVLVNAQYSQPTTGQVAMQQYIPTIQLPPADSNVALPQDNSQPWTLQQCIVYAQVHNISVRQQQLNVQMAQANLLASQGNMLPSLNAYASHTYNNGRTVDRYTNTFANSTVLSENFYLSSSVTLFSGLQTVNSIQQNKFTVEANRYQVQQTQYDIGMNVANAYLSVLYAEEQTEVAQQQVDLTQKQVDRMQQLFDAGAQAKGSLLDLQAQLGTEQVTLVSAQNNVIIAYLNLTQLMNLDSTAGFKIVKPELVVPTQNLVTTPEQIYQIAVTTLPGVKKEEMNYRSAEKGVSVAYGALSPSITLQGSLGTGYSGAAKTLQNSAYSGSDTIGLTTGGDYVLIPTYDNTYITTPFGDQVNNNVNKSVGIQVNIPIFNHFQASTSISKAKIIREESQLNIDLAKQQLYKNIQQAYADAQAAFLKYQASQRAVDASQEAFKYMEERFNLGAVNSIDYNNSKNQLAKAESDLLQAKYDYIFRMKVLDYYQGIPITF
jgi:outer membrane protein